MVEEEREGKEGLGSDKVKEGERIFALDLESLTQARTREMVKRAMTKMADDRDGDFVRIGSAFYYVGAAGTISQWLHERSIEEGGLQAPQTFEELVPPEYHEYRSVFSETAFNELPPS